MPAKTPVPPDPPAPSMLEFNQFSKLLAMLYEGPMEDIPWSRSLEAIRTCLRAKLEHGAGVIVNTSSIMGLVSGPGLSAYSASKAGVLGLTRSVAVDYASRGIRVNAICPGGIAHTAITDRPENQQDMAQLTLATPMQRLGEPADIASAVMWLCSPGASFVTGQAIAVDGGFTIW